MKRHLPIFVLIATLIFSMTVCAELPKSYTITYVQRDANQRQIMEQTLYVSDNTKMRSQIMMEGKISIDTIFRKDKKVIWILDHDTKQYMMSKYDQDLWDLAQTGPTEMAIAVAKKTGATKYKGVQCDVYEYKGTKTSSVSLISTDYNLLLKSQATENGKVIIEMDVRKFYIGKPDDALFELPAGYQEAKIK